MHVTIATSGITQGMTIASAVLWGITLVLIAVAVAGNWGITKRLPGWAVTLVLVVVGVLVLIALLRHSSLIGIAALVALFAFWVWFLARYFLKRAPDVAQRLSDPQYKEHQAELHAEQAEQAKRGDALEGVLGQVMREEHAEDIAAVESTETDND